MSRPNDETYTAYNREPPCKQISMVILPDLVFMNIYLHEVLVRLSIIYLPEVAG